TRSKRDWSSDVCSSDLASCSNRQNGEVSVKEDLTAKQLLQGSWVNDETEMPLMRIEGDTVYYANPQSAPVPFKVVHDTIYIYSKLGRASRREQEHDEAQ